MLTLPEKKDRLRKIPAEVPDFHNWLEVLFRKMPYVVHVEYTHGKDEFGADFVLEVTNPTVGRNEFVGVIAKKGTIKQDTTEVERQIKECGIPRIIKNGRDEQSLPIIWVITNEGVTGNAEKKIRHTYRQYAIQFFDADDVMRWTDNHAPHLWDDLPSKVSQYLHSVANHVTELSRKSAILADLSTDIKLELDLVAVDPDTYKKRRATSATVSLKDEVKLRKIVFVEGDMGSGKSQLLRDLATELCRPNVFGDGSVLPIFCTYREFAEKYDGSVDALITGGLGDLVSLVKNEKAVPLVVIDGLDEQESADSAASALKKLSEQIQASTHQVKAVVSCRSGVVSSSVLRSTSELRHLEVRPLSIRKMTNFIKAVCEKAHLRNRIARDIGKSDLFRQLPQNPIAALLLSRLMLQSPLRDELPQTLPGLYAKALELMLGRWDVEKGLGSQQEYDVAVRICGQIARFMIENRIPTVGISEIEARASEYLSERNLTINVKDLLGRLFSRSGVLVRDEATGTAYFKHRSFAEFFCASEWLHTSSFGVDLRALDPYWITVYFFAIGQLSDCEGTLKTILGLHPQSEEQRFNKLLAAPSYLLAGHMTPYRIVEQTLPGLFIEAARLYVDISQRRSPSVLSGLPPIPLLYLLQFMMRDRYAYQFFQKAIDATARDIADSIEEDLVKAHALFLLGVVGVDLEYRGALQFLAKRFKAGELPIGLAIAVRYESEKAQPRGMPAVLRAFNKRVHSLLKGNRSLRSTLDNMFSRPIGGSPPAQKAKTRRLASVI